MPTFLAWNTQSDQAARTTMSAHPMSTGPNPQCYSLAVACTGLAVVSLLPSPKDAYVLIPCPVSPDRGKFFVNFGLLFSSFNRHPCPDEFLHGFQSPITVGKRWDEGEQGNRVPFLSISDSERKAILVHVEGHAVDPACEQCRNPNYLPDGDPDLWFGSCRRMGCWAGCSSCIAKGKGGECSLVGMYNLPPSSPLLTVGRMKSFMISAPSS